MLPYRTVDADATALVDVVHVQTASFALHEGVILACFGVAVTLTLLTRGGRLHAAGPPPPLVEQRAAPVASLAARVVLALTTRFLKILIKKKKIKHEYLKI